MKITVEITWNKPKEQQWLCADNISLALHSYCRNTKFKVKELFQIKTTNILTEQSRHSISDCLKELKWNRPAGAQKFIDELIKLTDDWQITNGLYK